MSAIDELWTKHYAGVGSASVMRHTGSVRNWPRETGSVRSTVISRTGWSVWLQSLLQKTEREREKKTSSTNFFNACSSKDILSSVPLKLTQSRNKPLSSWIRLRRSSFRRALRSWRCWASISNLVGLNSGPISSWEDGGHIPTSGRLHPVSASSGVDTRRCKRRPARIGLPVVACGREPNTLASCMWANLWFHGALDTSGESDLVKNAGFSWIPQAVGDSATVPLFSKTSSSAKQQSSSSSASSVSSNAELSFDGCFSLPKNLKAQQFPDSGAFASCRSGTTDFFW